MIRIGYRYSITVWGEKMHLDKLVEKPIFRLWACCLSALFLVFTVGMLEVSIVKGLLMAGQAVALTLTLYGLIDAVVHDPTIRADGQ